MHITQTNGHYLMTPYIVRKGLVRISREVVFTFQGYLICEILRDFKSENISEMYTIRRKKNLI